MPTDTKVDRSGDRIMSGTRKHLRRGGGQVQPVDLYNLHLNDFFFDSLCIHIVLWLSNFGGEAVSPYWRLWETCPEELALKTVEILIL